MIKSMQILEAMFVGMESPRGSWVEVLKTFFEKQGKSIDVPYHNGDILLPGYRNQS